MYARLWWTLPYSFLVVPITTAMFTELSELKAEENVDGMKRGIVSGMNQILFFSVPFMLYLAVFAYPLVSLLAIGAFTMDDVALIASYLVVLAFALPFYGLKSYFQKVFSSLRKMIAFAVVDIVATVAQVAFTIGGALLVDYGVDINSVAAGQILFNLLAFLLLLAYLRRELGAFGMKSTIRAFVVSLVLGALGAAAGGGVLWLLQTFVGPLSGSILQSLAYVVAGGFVSLLVTFGLALKLKVPEAAMLSSIGGKISGKLKRA